MDTMINTEPVVKSKFWTKKKILLTILVVVVIAVVIFLLAQKYKAKKISETEAGKESKIFMGIEEFSKNANDDPQANTPIFQNISEESTVSGTEKISPEKQNAIFNSFSQ